MAESPSPSLAASLFPSAKNNSAVEELTVLGFPAFPLWQLLVIVGVASWIYVSHVTMLNVRVRSILQPYVSQHVQDSVPFLIRLQGVGNPVLDVMLASLSYSVSVEFYASFIPLMFWAGRSRLSVNMTLLMATCIYLGNCLKDVVSAPRPPSPPVRKLLASHTEEESAHEYGLPSSHTINSLALAGFLLYHLGFDKDSNDDYTFWLSAAVMLLFVAGVIYSRMYLGMHSPLDILAGLVMGCGILLVWFLIEGKLDEFISNGENVIPFWAVMTILLLFAYPKPEQRTPSYEFHTAFNGVAFGVVSGFHRTYQKFHHDGMEEISLIEGPGIRTLFLRLLVGLSVGLVVKALCKKLAIWLLPEICNLLGLHIHSTSYVPSVNTPAVQDPEEISLKQSQVDGDEKSDSAVTLKRRKSNSLQKLLETLEDEVLDVDTGVRLLQYAGFGWSVVELAPLAFSYLKL